MLVSVKIGQILLVLFSLFLSLSPSLLFFLQEKNLENIQPSRHYILSEICSFLHFILVLVNLPKSGLGRLS